MGGWYTKLGLLTATIIFFGLMSDHILYVGYMIHDKVELFQPFFPWTDMSEPRIVYGMILYYLFVSCLIGIIWPVSLFFLGFIFWFMVAGSSGGPSRGHD